MSAKEYFDDLDLGKIKKPKNKKPEDSKIDPFGYNFLETGDKKKKKKKDKKSEKKNKSYNHTSDFFDDETYTKKKKKKKPSHKDKDDKYDPNTKTGMSSSKLSKRVINSISNKRLQKALKHDRVLVDNKKFWTKD